MKYIKTALFVSILLLFIITCFYIVINKYVSEGQVENNSTTISSASMKAREAPTISTNKPQPSNEASENNLTSYTTIDTDPIEVKIQEDIPMEDRVTYQPGFYYESLSKNIKSRITGISYADNCTVPYEELRYVSVQHYDLDGKEQVGELICNQAIANDLVEIFYELYQAEYPIEQIRLIDEYQGDDTLSMMDNNTSCFNYRVVEGTTRLSKHALGMAIDINPFYNPYVTYPDGTEHVSPEGAEPYADRDAAFSFKITYDDLAYKLFTEHGFQWGGDWKNVKDYQHFQKE